MGPVESCAVEAGKDVGAGVGGESPINWWKPSDMSPKAVPWRPEEVIVLEQIS